MYPQPTDRLSMQACFDYEDYKQLCESTFLSVLPEIHKTTVLRIAIFWDITLYSEVKRSRPSKGTDLLTSPHSVTAPKIRILNNALQTSPA
jgi:hypothetical protein